MEKTVENLGELQLGEVVPLAGDALAELREQLVEGTGALGGMVVIIPVQGQVPGNAAQEGGQPPGSLGWDGVPGPEPGVVDAFLRVLVVL